MDFANKITQFVHYKINGIIHKILKQISLTQIRLSPKTIDLRTTSPLESHLRRLLNMSNKYEHKPSLSINTDKLYTMKY